MNLTHLIMNDLITICDVSIHYQSEDICTWFIKIERQIYRIVHRLRSWNSD